MARPKRPEVNLLSRDFESIRNDLNNFLKAFYPDVWKDFNVASPGMALVDLNAYVSELLVFVANKKYNENYLDGVTERKSVYRLAKTFGYDPGGFKPAVSVAEISIEVPPTADGPDEQYLPLFRPGAQLRGGGQTFETEFQIDFSSNYSEEGIANRIIQPNINVNQDIVSYTIIKREKIRAGTTKVISREVTSDEAQPFFSFTLPDTNVLEIESLIVKNQIGINESPTYQEFNDDNLKYYEVPSLAQNEIFVEDPNQNRTNGFAVGTYKEVEQRFEKEFLADGSCRIRFGNGTPNFSAYEKYLRDITSSSTNDTDIDASALLDNTALGKSIPDNSTIFVKYRVGGGLLSNVGANVLNEVGNINAVIMGSDPNVNQEVISSASANNPIPAVGGEGLPSVEEIKSQIAGNFASQDRAVTLRDYVAKAFQMPGRFGSPFRIQGRLEDNKVKLYILSRNANGQLVTQNSSVIKNNLKQWLRQFRMLNDFVEINDGKVINLQVEADLYIDSRNYNPNEVKASAIEEIRGFFNIESMQMNENIYVSQITDILREIPGVVNVVDLRFYNMEGGDYSTTTTNQATFNRTKVPGLTGVFRTQLELIDNTIFGTPLAMYEIRNPDVDIKVRSN